MRFAIPGPGLTLAAIAVAALLSGCGPSRAELEAEAARVAAVEAAAIAARQPPPVALNDSVSQSAAVYLTYQRDMATLRGGFASASEIQAALRRGAASDPIQVSRGLVAYASILALQSPEFVGGIRAMGDSPEARRRIIDRVVADPTYASTLPGADAAAGLIMAVLEEDLNALGAAADSVESDAYNIQSPGDQRSSWARTPLPDREGRLQAVKDIAERPMRPSMSEASRLYTAANAGSGLGVGPARARSGPYAPSVSNALAMAALAALGAAGDNAVPNTDALQYDRASQDCLASSRLNLYQCLAASRPSYEEIFCVGRHVLRDLATCARGATLPARIVTVDGPIQARTAPSAPATAPFPSPAPTIQPDAFDPSRFGPPAPTIRTAPIEAPQGAAPPPAPSVQPAPLASPGQSATQRLNSGPNR